MVSCIIAVMKDEEMLARKMCQLMAITYGKGNDDAVCFGRALSARARARARKHTSRHTAAHRKAYQAREERESICSSRHNFNLVHITCGYQFGQCAVKQVKIYTVLHNAPLATE